MSRSSRTAVRAEKAAAPAVVPRVHPALVGILAWCVPGAGHLVMGQLRKALTFFAVLVAMFAIGLAFGGRLFPFQLSEPLVFLASIAQWTQAMPRLIAAMAGLGAGNVVKSTIRKRKRVTFPPVLLITVLRISRVPKVELLIGSEVKSRTRFGGDAAPTMQVR